MRKIIFLIVLFFFFYEVKSQSDAERFKAQVQRVNTQGTTPPQTRYNFYADKLNSFLIENEWRGDQVTSIKEIKVMPLNDPSDWYYFVAVKTKKCLKPFILTYDIGDSNLGEMFIVEPAGYPIEFKNFVEKRIKDQVKSAEDLEVAKELYSEEAFKVFKEQVAPALVPYIKNKASKVKLRIEQTVDTLLDGYVPKDSTELPKEKFRIKLINYFLNSDLYSYNIAPDTALTIESFDRNNVSASFFRDMYVLDRKGSVNYYIAQQKKDYDERIQTYYRLSEKNEIAKIKENMWYKKIQYLKKEKSSQNK